MTRAMMFLRILIVIAVAELAAMFILQFFQVPDGIGKDLADAGLLVVLSAPPLYIWVARMMARRLADESIQGFLDNALDLVQSVTPHGRFLYVNHAWLKTLGYGRHEVLRLSAFDIIHPDHRDKYKALLACVWSGEAVENLETVFVAKDGRSIIVSGNVNCQFERGKPVATQGIFRDITERKRAEEALRESNEEVRLLLHSTAEAIYGLDLEGKCTLCNPACLRLLGYKEEGDLLRKDIHELIHHTHPDGTPYPFTDCHVHRALRHGAGAHVDNEVFWRSDGTSFPAEYWSYPIFRDQRRIGAVVSFLDITERKRAQEELKQAKEAAEMASRAKSEILANMSHEIRTPMNGIIGMTDLALDTDLKPEQREYLSMVKTSAGSLLRVINDILDFSKIEAGKLELDQVEFNLRDSLGDTLKALALRAHQKGLELASDISVEVPEVLRGDPTRLRQIFVNLVGNAIKFTERGEVIVKVEREAQAEDALTLLFTVKDTGIGIPADKQRKIFEPFTQADGSMTRRYGGTGLGLAIASQLVKAMGGRIWAESQPGEGSAFHFTVVLGFPQKPPEKATPVEVAALAGLPVLVVDDNATNRRILEEMLVRWRMLPALAEGGWTALAALERARDAGKPFPLVLIDAQMPDMDGFTLAERIRLNPRLSGATVMMLTSAGQPGDAARCRALGIVAYLIKPVRQSELLDAILLALGRSAEKAPAPPLITRHSLREARRKLRILLAEDNAVNRELVVRWLEKWGHAVVTAHNGREALAALEKSSADGGPFDLILMDVQMPDMDGLEATAVIRSREKETGQHLPIVALTAHAMKGDRERCLAAGMDEYVAKPVQPRELLDTLERLTSASPPAAPAAPAEGAGVLDLAEVLARVDGDAQLLAELAGLFLEEGPKLLSAVQEAVARRDARALERAAHALKGSAGNFAAPAVFGAVSQLELMGREGDLTRANEACVALEAEMLRLLRSLESLRKKVVA